jgi:ATP-binding cassette subfamily A (ABC1) protein 3
MLTGDEIMSGGDACLMNNDLRGNKKKFLQNIGYCPQFDSIIDVLTGN